MIVKLLMVLSLGVLGFHALKKWLFSAGDRPDIGKPSGTGFNKADAVDAEFEEVDE